MPAPQAIPLTLHDRLSRLTHAQACKLLGTLGRQVIRDGGKFDIALNEQVRFDDTRFVLTIEDAEVTITLSSAARELLHWRCEPCRKACVHVGAAFALILEEKMALGLAAAPDADTPLEALAEHELEARALAERSARSREEKMSVEATDSAIPWSDYLVTSQVSGKTHRVALRGLERGESFCSCPDFKKNALGTCKHILHVLTKVKRRFPAAKLWRAARRTRAAVALHYGETVSLRLHLPDRLAPEIDAIVRPFAGVAITRVDRLLVAVRELESRGHDVVVYPDAEAFIEQQLRRERLAKITTKIRLDPAAHPLRTSLLRVELLPYQLDGIAFAVGAGRAVLADDMGLGKTIQAIGVAELLAREAGITRVLVICPASVKSQWVREIENFSGRSSRIVLGTAAERAQSYARSTFFTVCNYEQVLRDLQAIERTPWDLVVLDEAQRIKNWQAKTTAVIKSLRAPFALALTGTPLENRLDELYSIVEFIDDRRLGAAFRFFHRHRVVGDTGRIAGYRNLTSLRKQLAPVLLRRTRSAVMRDLPPRTTEVVRIPPTEEQLDIHAAQMRIVSSIVRKAYISEMDLLRLQKALLMCRMSADSTFLVNKQRPAHSSKLERLGEILDSLLAEPQRKIVLFSEWTTMLDEIEPLIRRSHARYVRLDGKVPQKKRQQLVHEFQHDAKCRVFLTSNAGSVGLNLHAADTVINVDLPWNPAVLEQRIGRAHRMGQKRPVQVFVLITEGSIEENLLAALSMKHELFQAVLDPDATDDAIDFSSGIEELKRRLELLLGAVPSAPVDASQRQEAQRHAEQLAQRERVSRACGKLLASAIDMLGEMLPQSGIGQDGAGSALRDKLTRDLNNCVARDDQGQLQLVVTLPDANVVPNLAASLARLMSAQLGSV